MRHLTDEIKVGIDPSGTVLKWACNTHGPADVTGPYRRCQTVLGIIGPIDCVFRVRKTRDCNDRSENFPPDNLISLKCPCNNRWLEEETVAGFCFTTGRNFYVLLGRSSLDESFNAVALRCRNKRPHLYIRISL